VIAVLCVAKNSIYKTLDVDCYDIDRDVRSFDRSCTIVAHPPCRSWSAYCAHQAKPLPGEKELGPLCVEILKECGGVLEHPAHSRLWDHCKLPQPGSRQGDIFCQEVNQSWWGDSRLKKTWLLFCKCEPLPIPFRLHDTRGDRRRWQLMSKHQRSATHPEFAKWLVATAGQLQAHATRG
jgi:hypothetical protein